MNAVQWEKLRKNWEDLQCLIPGQVCAKLFQREVISDNDKEKIKRAGTSSEQIEQLLLILQKKPRETNAYSALLEVIKSDPCNDWLIAQITDTKCDSDPSVRAPDDPQLLEDDIRKILRAHFANKEGAKTPLSDFRDVLKKELGTFSGRNEWDNKYLQDFIRREFVDVDSELKKKRDGRNARKIIYMTNMKKIDSSQVERQDQDLKARGACSESVQHTDMKDMTPLQLKEYLLPKFQVSGFSCEILDTLEKESISGRVFLTMKEDDFKSVVPSAPFGVRRFLSLEIQENTPSTDARIYPEYPRRFDTDVGPTVKYFRGRCMDATVIARGDLITPLKNFHLCNTDDKDSRLEYISSEIIPFVSACLNDRRNGTIYFGVSPSDEGGHKAGEVVGLDMRVDEVNAEVSDALNCSYLEDQRNIIHNTVRTPRFLPVVVKDSQIQSTSNLWVVEVDVVPSSCVLEDDSVKTKLKYLPIHAKRSKIKDLAIFKFSDEGVPQVAHSTDLHMYEKDHSRIANQRREEENKVKKSREPIPNLRTQLLNLLTGGRDTLEDTVFLFLMTSPIDSHMDMEYLSKSVSFIKHLEAEVVFDFDPTGSSKGIYKHLDSMQSEVCRVLTTKNFDSVEYEPREKYEEFKLTLKSETRTSWIFCNGYEEMSLDQQGPKEWNKKRRKTFEESLQTFKDNFDVERIIFVIFLFSKNYETMIEACERVLSELPDNWLLLAESEDIAKLWQDQILMRNKAEKIDLTDRCVIGMPWEEVDATIRQVMRRNEMHECLLTTSRGTFVKVREKKLRDWCDIDVLQAGDFDINDGERKRKEQEVEELFYRGEEASWLNFWFHDQVLKRDIHNTLMSLVENALNGRGKEEEDKVTYVPILHQPGAGGTTSAKHVLWEMRRIYRCCVVNAITDQTCDQLDELWRYKDETPKPLLVLIDNEDEDKCLQLRGHLEEKGRKH